MAFNLNQFFQKKQSKLYLHTSLSLLLHVELNTVGTTT